MVARITLFLIYLVVVVFNELNDSFVQLFLALNL